MENTANQINGVPKRKPLARSNTALIPTTNLWNLTQAPRPKLCRCHSVHNFQTCCSGDIQPTSPLDIPFFANKSPAKKNMKYLNYDVWSKSFCKGISDRLQRPDQELHTDKTPVVTTIYDPQTMPSTTSYSGSHKPLHYQMPWPGRSCWFHPIFQKAFAFSCAFILTLIIMIVLVGKPVLSGSKVTWVDVILISGEFRITNEQYRATLSNHSSSDFLLLSNIISQELDSLFSLSVLSEPYHSTSVTELLEGSGGGLGVRCQLVLQASAKITAIKVGLTFIGGLRNSHGHVWLGNFSVDIQSIGFQADRDAVTWTDWSSWGECQQTPDFGFVQLRSRNCTLRSGQYLHSPLPCLLVPHSQGNIETIACLPFSPLALRREKLVKTTRIDCKNRTSVDIEHIFIDDNSNNTLTNSTANLLQQDTKPCLCASDEVCVALAHQSSPHCLPALDSADPTGCGGHCKLNTQSCQKLLNNSYRCVEDSKCLEGEWRCGNHLCIPLSKRCDGHFNCYDHTDEMDCDCKGKNQFTCNNSQCIPDHRFCDGFPDCTDHSDEPFGCGGHCKIDEWQCRNGRCIQSEQVCNDKDDCEDRSDEVDCSSLTIAKH